MLTGEFYNTIDDKGRILIPSRLRSALEGGEALYVTRGLENCLWLMLPTDFEKLKNTIMNGPGAMFDRKLRILQRGMIAPRRSCVSLTRLGGSTSHRASGRVSPLLQKRSPYSSAPAIILSSGTEMPMSSTCMQAWTSSWTQHNRSVK